MEVYLRERVRSSSDRYLGNATDHAGDDDVAVPHAQFDLATVAAAVSTFSAIRVARSRQLGFLHFET
jgi:hypothetical protein